MLAKVSRGVDYLLAGDTGGDVVDVIQRALDNPGLYINAGTVIQDVLTCLLLLDLAHNTLFDVDVPAHSIRLRRSALPGVLRSSNVQKFREAVAHMP